MLSYSYSFEKLLQQFSEIQISTDNASLRAEMAQQKHLRAMEKSEQLRRELKSRLLHCNNVLDNMQAIRTGLEKKGNSANAMSNQ